MASFIPVVVGAAIGVVAFVYGARAQTVAPAQAVAVPKLSEAEQQRRCSDIDAMFKPGGVQGYRPLVTLAPVRYSDRPGTLALSINARLGNRGTGRLVRVGNYMVRQVPVWEIAPQAGTQTTAYVADPQTGYRCVLSRGRMLDPDFQQAWIYGGALLALKQGDTLRTRVTSVLDFARATDVTKPEASINGGVPCQATNQHTHGLLVNAWNADGTRGDYVFDLAQPAGRSDDACGGTVHAAHGATVQTLDHVIRIPGRAADPRRSMESGQHPSGLYWFHPHGHGYSAYQVRGGTTGLITIGVPEDTISLPARGRNTSKAENIRELMLKDAQLRPDPASAQTWQFGAKYDSGFCGDAGESSPIFAGGECAGQGDFAGGRWVYTINGVQYPHFAQDIASYESELWRIANASANVSYRLMLYPKKADGAIDRDAAKRKEFQVLSLDGVTVDTASDSGSPQMILAREVFLMPGSRVSVLLPPDPGKSFVLVTEAVETGQDVWAPVALAEVTWPAGPADVASGQAAPAPMARATMAARGPAARNSEGAQALAVTARSTPEAAANICDMAAGRERVILFVKRKITDPDPEVFGLVAAERSAGDPDLSKAIYYRDKSAMSHHGDMQHMHTVAAAAEGPPTFDPSGFETVSWDEIGKLFATPVDRSGTSSVAYARSLSPAFGQSPILSQVCTRLGRTERWVIENWTDEIHNFHIHQTKFAISDDRSPAYFNAPYPYSFAQTDAEKLALCPNRQAGDTRFTATDCAIAARYMGVLRANHDSVPVPRAKGTCDGVPGGAGCEPGRVTIVIAFDRQEQIGRYPFHCHILEHEDLGMMGQIDVLPASTARR